MLRTYTAAQAHAPFTEPTAGAPSSRRQPHGPGPLASEFSSPISYVNVSRSELPLPSAARQPSFAE